METMQFLVGFLVGYLVGYFIRVVDRNWKSGGA